MSDERAMTTTKHVLTSTFNRFERPQQRGEAINWSSNIYLAANAERSADNELLRRIKWPTDLNSLGIDSFEAFRSVPRLTLPFHFPAARASPMLAPQSALSSSSSHSDQTTIATMPSSSISDKNHNPNDTFNRTTNIVPNLIDIVANTTNIVTHITNIAIAAAAVGDGAATASATATATAQQAIPDDFAPMIYIDENGIFQIKYVRRACVGKNNATVPIEMFTTNAISPIIANSGSQQRTNTTSSIDAEIDEAAINSYDDQQQFEIDIRFGGKNESVKNSNRDCTTAATTISSSSSTTAAAIHNDTNVNVEKSRDNNINTIKAVENEHR